MTCHVVGGGEQRKEQICQKCESCRVLKNKRSIQIVNNIIALFFNEAALLN